MNPPRRENADELRFRCMELLRDFNHKCCENNALRAKLDAAKSVLWMAERYTQRDIEAGYAEEVEYANAMKIIEGSDGK